MLWIRQLGEKGRERKSAELEMNGNELVLQKEERIKQENASAQAQEKSLLADEHGSYGSF